MSSRFDDFSNQGQPLVIQFTVKHEQSIDCGGGYIKLFPSGLSQEELHGDSVYNIMFGQWDYRCPPRDGLQTHLDLHGLSLDVTRA